MHRNQQGEIACRRLHQQFLVDVFDASDVEPIHSPGVELMRKVTFDFLAPLPQHPLPSISPRSPRSGSAM
jgi:hypothetical protein